MTLANISIALLILVAIAASIDAAFTLIRPGNGSIGALSPFTASTPDYFLLSVSPYTHTGPVLLLPFDEGCSVNISSIPVAPSGSNASARYDNTIVLAQAAQAVERGCGGYEQITYRVHAAIPQLQARGWPEVLTLILLTDVDAEHGPFGGPVGDPHYRAQCPTCQRDVLPPLDTAMMSRSDAISLISLFPALPEVWTATVVAEEGAWNARFLHPSWIAVSWVASITNLLLLLYAASSIYRALLAHTLALDLRHGLYALATISTALTTIFPTLRLLSTPRIILEYSAYPLQSLIRTLSLLLWSRVLWGIRHSVSHALVQACIILGFVAALWEWAWGLISWLGPQAPVIYLVSRATQIALPVIYLSLGAIFALYTRQFWRHGQSRSVSQKSIRTLHQITKITAASFALYLIIALTTAISAIPTIQQSPQGLFWSESLFILWQSCDNAVIILGLGVQVPAPPPPIPSASSSRRPSANAIAHLHITQLSEVHERRRSSIDIRPSSIITRERGGSSAFYPPPSRRPSIILAHHV